MNHHLLTLVCLFVSCLLFAQDSEIVRCGHTSEAGGNQEFERWMSDQKENSFSRTNRVLQIPVIFHVIHSGTEIGTGYNISASQIEAQLEQINNDLRKKAGTSGDNSFPQGADTKIELIPALYDENLEELAEEGIHRIDATSQNLAAGSYSKTYVNNIIKPLTQWDPSLYFNIWVCDLSSGLLGFAQFPEASGLDGVTLNGTSKTDGVVVLYKTVGSTEMPNPAASGAYANYNKGRTLTHELGHALGLRHIWGDGSCSVDDYCTDTPSSDGANYGCPDNHYSCGTLDMVENYMDYTYDTCMNVFTADQKARMRTVMLNSPRRVELLASDRARPIGSLPVELLSYDAHLEKELVNIKWATATEMDNSHFVLSKSRDGLHFKEIARVEGKGNSLEKTDYTYVDKELFLGENYYKLVQVDFDGRATELGIRTIAFRQTNMDLSIYPNPTRSDIMLNLYSVNTNEVNIQLFDAKGVLVKNQTQVINPRQETTLTIELDGLGRGIYFVRVISGEKELTQRFNKI